MTKLGSGVTIIEASKFLGYWASPILLSRLVKHVNIPKWSRCHPVGYVGESKATQAEQEAWMDSIGWGFNMKSVLPMNTDEETYASAITLSQGDVWEYSGMTPTQDYPGRLADFRWCNGDAEIPFLPVELYYYDPGIEYHRGPTIQLKWARNLSPNSEINPYNYNVLRGNYHILLRKLGDTTGSTMLSTGVTETFTAMTTSNITMESGDTGTYECCAAIARSGGNHEVYPLPGTYTKFTVRNRTEEEYLGLSLTNQCSMRMSSTTVGQLTVKLKLTNLTNEAISADVGCDVYDSRGERLWQKLNHGVTIPANGSITLYGKTDPEAFVTTDPGEIKVEDVGAQGQFRPPIKADCKVTRLGITMTKSATILNS